MSSQAWLLPGYWDAFFLILETCKKRLADSQRSTTELQLASVSSAWSLLRTSRTHSIRLEDILLNSTLLSSYFISYFIFFPFSFIFLSVESRPARTRVRFASSGNQKYSIPLHNKLHQITPYALSFTTHTSQNHILNYSVSCAHSQYQCFVMKTYSIRSLSIVDKAMGTSGSLTRANWHEHPQVRAVACNAEREQCLIAIFSNGWAVT